MGIKKIDLAILTHPHTDHFSGFTELLRTCDKDKIALGIFGHTASPLKVYRDKVIKSLAGKAEFTILLDELDRLEKTSVLKKVGFLNSMTEDHSLGIKIKILSPGQFELIRVEGKQAYEEENEGIFPWEIGFLLQLRSNLTQVSCY